MARTVLIEASPLDATTAAVVGVYLAGGGSRGYTHRGRNTWRAGIVEEPKFSGVIGFDESGWTGSTLPQSSKFDWKPALPSILTAVAAYQWKNAAIEILVGDDSTAAPAWTTTLKGTVSGIRIKGGAIEFTVADLSVKLGDPMLTARFTGGGGIEGDAEVEGRIKRRSFGKVFNVEGRSLLKAYNIFEFNDPANPLQSFVTVRDKGRAAAPAPTVLAWQGSIAATLAALQASAPASGSCVVAPSIGCVKWWTQPSGPLTADLQGEVGAGYVSTAVTIAQRIVTAVAGLGWTAPSAGVTASPGGTYEAGIHVGDDGETIATVLDRLLLGAGLPWIPLPDGSVVLREFTFANPVEVVPIVGDIERVEAYRPVISRRIAYQRSYRKHDAGEISAAVQTTDLEGLVDFGTQVGGATRPDNNATRNVNERALNRNAAFVDLLVGWVNPYAGTASAIAHANGTRGGFVAVLDAGEGVRSEQLGVTPGETIWFNYRFLTVANRTGAVAPSWYCGLEFGPAVGSAPTADGGPVSAVAVSVAAGAQANLVSIIVPAGMYAVDARAVIDVGNAGSGAQGHVDYMEISKDQPGADVTDSSLPYHSAVPSDQTVLYTAAGVAKSGQLSRTFNIKRNKGTTDVSQDNDTAWTINLSGCTATINNTNGSGIKGRVTLSAVDQDGWFEVVSTKNSLPVKNKVPVWKVLDPPSAGGGAGSTGFDASLSGSITETTYVTPQVLATGTMRSNGSGQVVFTGSATYDTVGSSTTATLAAKVQKSLAGANSWSDLTGMTGINGSTASSGPDFNDTVSGFINFAGTGTGLTASTDYDFRLVAIKSGSTATITPAGVLYGRQS